MDHERYMREAMKEADKAAAKGCPPFGAVIVDPEGKIVARGHDHAKLVNDPSAHAESTAARHLFKKMKGNALRGYCCYSTSEPCVMCMSICMKVGIDNFYYGAPMQKSASLYIRAKDIAKKYKKLKINVVSGILKNECIKQRDSCK